MHSQQMFSRDCKIFRCLYIQYIALKDASDTDLEILVQCVDENVQSQHSKWKHVLHRLFCLIRFSCCIKSRQVMQINRSRDLTAVQIGGWICIVSLITSQSLPSLVENSLRIKNDGMKNDKKFNNQKEIYNPINSYFMVFQNLWLVFARHNSIFS